jgi:hypothetical protein
MIDKGFQECIQRMVKAHGKKVLLDGKSKNLIGDYCAGQYKKEADILIKLLEAGCGKLINEAENVPEAEHKLVARMEEEKGLSQKATVDLMDLLGFILRGDTGKTITPDEMEAAAKTKAIAEAKARADNEAAARARAEAKATLCIAPESPCKAAFSYHEKDMLSSSSSAVPKPYS